MRIALFALGAALLFSTFGCQPRPEVRFHASDVYPDRLSDWNLLTRQGDTLVLGANVEPYEVITPLFSDYALKLRTIYLPPGTRMTFRAGESFDFPVGSIIAKTFFYHERDGVAQADASWGGDVASLDLGRHRLLETRLLVRQAEGWDALPYVWDGDDARLGITGAVLPASVDLGAGPVDFPYLVPSRGECAGCHATDHGEGSLDLIGLKARHLNRAYPGAPMNQLKAWSRAGRLDGLPDRELTGVARWDDPAAKVSERARAYLDINCGHCHSATGAAGTSGLMLDSSTTRFRQLGVCKPPIAAGRGTGGRTYSIVPGNAEASILLFRMETSDPATRMPEMGRHLPHREGVELMREWIEGLPGECV